MPCSAVECRREGTTLPVSIVRPVLDTDYNTSRSKYSADYLRRSSLNKTSEKSEYSRYSSSRMIHESKVPILSTRLASTKKQKPASDSKTILKNLNTSSSMTDKKTSKARSAVLSRSEETSRSRESSRVRANSHSESVTTTMATRPPRKPVTTFDIAEFRSLYSPDSYVVGSSSRTYDSSSRSDSAYGSRSESYSHDSSFSRDSTYSRDSTSSYSSRPPLDTRSRISTKSTESPTSRLTTAKATESPSSRLATKTTDSATNEVTTDENDNVETEQVSESNNDTIEQEAQSTDTSDDSQESFQPRIGKSSVLNTNSNAKKEPEIKDTNGLSGLRNIGNTCFLNSVVQCLSNTRLLKDYLITKEYLPDVSNSESRGALIKSFAEVIQELWSGEGRIVNTSAFKSQVQKYAPRFMGYSQQDAQEFLRYLLQGIHDDVNRITTKPRNLPPVNDDLPDSEKSVECWRQYLKYDDSKIVDLFVGQLKSTLRCTVCGHCSTTFEVFWDLSLPLPSRAGNLRLAQCLECFTKEEILDGDEMPTCSKCKTRRKCTKSFSIYKFPKILVLHLKRFSPSERYRKLSATVEFPLTGLDMSSYASSTSAPTYNLYAVSNHSGTAYSGHYTAYCMHPHAHSWHEYNDSRVSSISPRNVVSSEAYILFYEQASHQVTTSRL